MDLSKQKAEDWLDDLETVGGYAAEKIGDVTKDMPIVKALGNIAANPTRQEVGAQVVNLSTAFNKGVQESFGGDPVDIALNYGPNAMGTIYKGFHQTSKKAAEAIKKEGFRLDIPGARATDTELPDGVFFKPHSGNIGVGAADPKDITQIKVKADISNPLEVLNRQEFNRIINDFDPKITSLRREVDAYEKEAVRKFDELEKEYYRPGITIEDSDAIMDKQDAILKDNEIFAKEKAKDIRERITNALRDKGYDGVILTEDVGSFNRKTETIVTLNPTKITAEEFLDQ